MKISIEKLTGFDVKVLGHIFDSLKLFPPERLQILCRIGEGTFSKGLIEFPRQNTRKEVAVKRLENFNLEEANVFFEQISNMMKLKHQNVIELVGVTIRETEGPYLIYPFMSNGDVKSFLMEKSREVTFRQILYFALGTAEGMKYLESKGFVHRNLKASNCLLDDQLAIRISDFGLKRNVHGRGEYCQIHSPSSLRWMAPESFKEPVFTTKSDVWSYGVTLWELMTRGKDPYVQLKTSEVFMFINSDQRLAKPAGCTNEGLYDLMLKCWSKQPDSRPTFEEIIDIIKLCSAISPPTPATFIRQRDQLDALESHGKLIAGENLERPGYLVGRGNFGVVYRGRYTDPHTNETKEVAMKTMKEIKSIEQLDSLIDEALIMHEFDHPNVLSLIGLSLPKDSLPIIITPYMKNGDLLNYMRNERAVPLTRMIRFILDISRGMKYLADKKCVHRDLAARNCMLDDTLNVRVADFGLTRSVTEKGYYRTDKQALPINWMPPESLRHRIFNTKTDVWAYGVTCWEVFSRLVTCCAFVSPQLTYSHL